MSLPVFLSLLRLSLIKYLVCQNPRLLVPGSPCTVTPIHSSPPSLSFLFSLGATAFPSAGFSPICMNGDKACSGIKVSLVTVALFSALAIPL